MVSTARKLPCEEASKMTPSKPDTGRRRTVPSVLLLALAAAAALLPAPGCDTDPERR